MKYFLIVLCLLSTQLFGATIDVGYMPKSTHFSDCAEHCPKGDDTFMGGEYNEDNNLVFVTVDNWTSFYMKNSYGNDSFFIGRKVNSVQNENISMFLVGGLVTGYDDIMPDIVGVSPGGYIGLDFHPVNNRFGVIVSMSINGAASIGVRFRL